jgi:hypothetical protein
MDCPLPIDWLDYLENRDVDDGVDLDAHLADCPRCELLVDELRRQSVAVELAPYEEEALAHAPKWTEEERGEVAIGQIWLTAGSGKTYAALRRQIVLVVAAREEFEQTWFSITPLTTETELATNADLLLGANDTTLAIPLAAQFRLQTPLAREQLESYLGQATESGQELVTAAVAGTLDSEHFGAALSRANDRRLRRLEETREIMARLGSDYGEALARAEEAEEAEANTGSDDPVAVLEPAKAKALAFAKLWHEQVGSEDELDVDVGAGLFVFQLKAVKPAAPERQLELAAATVARSNPWINHFAFERERYALRVRLELKDPMRGEEMLLLLIDHVSGFPSAPMLISFATTAGVRIESEPFDPTKENQVVIARGAVGISPAEVEELVLRPEGV